MTARRGRSARRVAGSVLLAALVAAAAWLAVGFLHFQREVTAAVEPQAAPRVDGIVVLTGGSQRLNDAFALMEDGRGKRLLVSGVHEKTTREEIARLSGASRQMLDCCVDLGRSARNTIGNALEARRWAKAHGFKSLMVVTSNYHMPRTIEEFEHAFDGVAIVGRPVVGDAGDGHSLSLRLMASEYAKIIVSRLRRAVEQDPEHSRLPVFVGRQKPLGPLPIEGSSGG